MHLPPALCVKDIPLCLYHFSLHLTMSFPCKRGLGSSAEVPLSLLSLLVTVSGGQLWAPLAIRSAEQREGGPGGRAPPPADELAEHRQHVWQLQHSTHSRRPAEVPVCRPQPCQLPFTAVGESLEGPSHVPTRQALWTCLSRCKFQAPLLSACANLSYRAGARCLLTQPRPGTAIVAPCLHQHTWHM